MTERGAVGADETGGAGARRGRWSGPWIAALVAGCASLPGLALPFLSDDWAQIEAVGAGIPGATPFGDFRPLYMATLRLDRVLWGLRPAGFHLTNLLLIAAAAGLVVAVIRRHTGDPGLALGAGLVFAFHPCHVENAAWIAARGDPLAAVPYLLALLAYDRWRERAAGPPLLVLVLYWLALLAKETAISLPFLLMLLDRIDPRRRPAAAWRFGYLPLIGVSLAHFLALRLLFLGGWGRTLSGNLGLGAPKTFLGMAAAAILPLDLEHLVRHPFVWGALASGIAVGPLFLAPSPSPANPGAVGAPRFAAAAAAIFAILAAPYLVGLQDRYLFLPSAAAALFLARAIRSAGRRAPALAILLAAGWLAGGWTRWTGWREAAAASRALVADLGRAADAPGVGEIVVADMPFRVHGGSVAGDFRAALALGGHRPVPVRAVTYVSFPDAGADPVIAGAGDAAFRRPGFAEIGLRIPDEAYWRLVYPRPPEGVETTSEVGSVLVGSGGRVRVRLPPAANRGRAAYVWSRGGLERLF